MWGVCSIEFSGQPHLLGAGVAASLACVADVLLGVGRTGQVQNGEREQADHEKLSEPVGHRSAWRMVEHGDGHVSYAVIGMTVRMKTNAAIGP